MPDSRAVWWVSPSGFAHAAPLSGTRMVAAVGSVRPGREIDDARAAMAAALDLVAFTEGHDAQAVLDRTNMALSEDGLGRIDALALISHANDEAAVSGVGSPMPLVVTDAHLTAPAATWVGLAPGWTVVLGGAEDSSGLLSPAEVRAALSMLDEVGGAVAIPARQTMLAIALDG
jgi:hypothetical protein